VIFVMASFVVLRLAPKALHRGVPLLVAKQSAVKQCGVVFMKKANMSFWSNRNNSIAATGKSEYDIEVEKIAKKEKFEHYYGFFKGDTIFDKAHMHFFYFCFISVGLVFVPIMMMYGPDFKSQMRDWKKREAIRLIEQREAAGELLINPDFAPPALVEEMVPEAGDWEEQWLRDQPSLFIDSRPKYYTMVDTN